MISEESTIANMFEIPYNIEECKQKYQAILKMKANTARKNAVIELQNKLGLHKLAYSYKNLMKCFETELYKGTTSCEEKKIYKFLCGRGWCTVCTPNSCYPLLQVWDPENKDENGKPLTVFDVPKGASSFKVKFWCRACDHRWDNKPNEANPDILCMYCAKTVKPDKRCKVDCELCLKNVLVIPERWTCVDIKDPSHYTKGCHDKFALKCNECKHITEMVAYAITVGNGCGICAKNSNRLCGLNCEVCLSRSCYVYRHIWSRKNEESPEMVKLCSDISRLFDCHDCGSEYWQTPHNKSNGKQSCPTCKHKTERKLFEFLKSIFTNTMTQVKYDWCRNKLTGRNLPFDFLVNEKIIIELDGIQHFEQVSCWKNTEGTREFDIYKMEKAIEHGYKIIRIQQECVWMDKFDWKNMLHDLILSIDSIDESIIYLDSTGLYERYYPLKIMSYECKLIKI